MDPKDTIRENILPGTKDEDTFSLVFKLIHLVCSYYVPNTASILWWTFGVWSLLFGNLYLQYLYTSYFFFDIYVASAINAIIKYDLPYFCPAIDGKDALSCYCMESHAFASYFWTVLAHVAEYGPWPPPRWPTFICTISFFVFVSSLCISRQCGVLGVIFAAIIGAMSGVLKIQLYKAAIYPLCRAIIVDRTKKT